MASVVALVLMLVVLAFHTLVAAVMTRYFRVVLNTNWGWVLYTLFFVPVTLLASTLLFTGPLGIGIDLGSSTAVLAIMIVLPLSLGVTIDVLYVRPPEEVELPQPREE